MRVLGIKSTPAVVRYALLKKDGDLISFENANTESKLPFPASMKAPEERVKWLHEELRNLIQKHSDIECVAIKVNDFGRSESELTRDSTYWDAIVMLTAEEMHKPVKRFMNKALRTTRKEITQKAEDAVGRTKVNWDENIAGAALAAWNVLV